MADCHWQRELLTLIRAQNKKNIRWSVDSDPLVVFRGVPSLEAFTRTVKTSPRENTYALSSICLQEDIQRYPNF